MKLITHLNQRDNTAKIDPAQMFSPYYSPYVASSNFSPYQRSSDSQIELLKEEFKKRISFTGSLD